MKDLLEDVKRDLAELKTFQVACSALDLYGIATVAYGVAKYIDLPKGLKEDGLELVNYISSMITESIPDLPLIYQTIEHARNANEFVALLGQCFKDKDGEIIILSLNTKTAYLLVSLLFVSLAEMESVDSMGDEFSLAIRYYANTFKDILVSATGSKAIAQVFDNISEQLDNG